MIHPLALFLPLLGAPSPLPGADVRPRPVVGVSFSIARADLPKYVFKVAGRPGDEAAQAAGEPARPEDLASFEAEVAAGIAAKLQEKVPFLAFDPEAPEGRPRLVVRLEEGKGRETVTSTSETRAVVFRIQIENPQREGTPGAVKHWMYRPWATKTEGSIQRSFLITDIPAVFGACLDPEYQFLVRELLSYVTLLDRSRGAERRSVLFTQRTLGKTAHAFLPRMEADTYLGPRTALTLVFRRINEDEEIEVEEFPLYVYVPPNVDEYLELEDGMRRDVYHDSDAAWGDTYDDGLHCREPKRPKAATAAAESTDDAGGGAVVEAVFVPSLAVRLQESAAPEKSTDRFAYFSRDRVGGLYVEELVYEGPGNTTTPPWRVEAPPEVEVP